MSQRHVVNAMDLVSHHGLSIWDSVIVAAAAEAECQGVTVANPYAPARHPLLAGLLATPED